MAELPERPFLTEDFSLKGAGIDFLGLRWVNLEILTRYLLPDVNNATEDLGVYCMAAWIPWKFRTICTDETTFKLSKFKKFRQAVEVAMSHVTREDSPATEKFGVMHRRIGAQQEVIFPSMLDFTGSERTEATSIYAAPLYGPSVRYLNLLMPGKAEAKDGTSTGIPLTSADPNTMKIVNAIDSAIRSSHVEESLKQFGSKTFTGVELDELGLHGLHPAFCRHLNDDVKQAFLEKLLPNDVSNGRTLTTRLIIATLDSSPGLNSMELRHVWHTGLYADGSSQNLVQPELAKQRVRWKFLMIRQYQRYILEYFMKCFELGIKAGNRRLDTIVEYSLTEFVASFSAETTVREAFLHEAASVSSSSDLATISEKWALLVHPQHPSYVDASTLEDDQGCALGFSMLARWWFGSVQSVFAIENAELSKLGGEDRLSIFWFAKWIGQRLDLKVSAFVRDLFEGLVFGQHVRVALSRFDGEGQRLRFTVGDEGIVPTKSVAKKLATGIPGWMADRLDAFVNLLTDLSVLKKNSDGRLNLGSLAEFVAAYK